MPKATTCMLCWLASTATARGEQLDDTLAFSLNRGWKPEIKVLVGLSFFRPLSLASRCQHIHTGDPLSDCTLVFTSEI